jgi:hypothetical protein
MTQRGTARFGHALDDFPFRPDQFDDTIQYLIVAVILRVCPRL